MSTARTWSSTTRRMTAIRAIAERLGGLPLALELAAARIRDAARPTQIRERLEHSLDLRRRCPGPAGATADAAGRDRLERRAASRRRSVGCSPGSASSPAAGRRRRRAGRECRRRPRNGRRRRTRVARRQEPDPDRASPERRRRRTTETRFSLHPLLREYALRAPRRAGRAPRDAKARSPRSMRGDRDDGRRRDPRRDRRGDDAPARSRGAQPARRGRLVARARRSRRRSPDHRRHAGAGISSVAGSGRPVGCSRGSSPHRAAATPGCGSQGWRRKAASRTGWTTSRPPTRPTGSASSWRRRRAIPSSMADAHYDIGFLSMVAHEGDLLRRPRAAGPRPVPRGRPRGRGDPGAARARAGRVPGG